MKMSVESECSATYTGMGGEHDTAGVRHAAIDTCKTSEQLACDTTSVMATDVPVLDCWWCRFPPVQLPHGSQRNWQSAYTSSTTEHKHVTSSPCTCHTIPSHPTPSHAIPSHSMTCFVTLSAIESHDADAIAWPYAQFDHRLGSCHDIIRVLDTHTHMDKQRM